MSAPNLVQTNIIAQIDLSPVVNRLNDADRVQWIKAILESISEDGTIDIIRVLVKQERWNDQDPE